VQRKPSADQLRALLHAAQAAVACDAFVLHQPLYAAPIVANSQFDCVVEVAPRSLLHSAMNSP
jgi:hypothetical protein